MEAESERSANDQLDVSPSEPKIQYGGNRVYSHERNLVRAKNPRQAVKAIHIRDGIAESPVSCPGSSAYSVGNKGDAHDKTGILLFIPGSWSFSNLTSRSILNSDGTKTGASSLFYLCFQTDRYLSIKPDTIVQLSQLTRSQVSRNVVSGDRSK